MSDRKIKKKVAVIMSVYKQEEARFFDLSLNSILKSQTYQNFDVHLAIDGHISHDLNEVIKRYTENYNNLFLYPSEIQLGLSENLNNIIKNLDEDISYMARMDSDDIAFPERLEEQVSFLEENEEVDIVGSSIIEIGDDGMEKKLLSNPETHKEIINYFGFRNPISHPTVMFRSSFFQKAGLYPVTHRDWYPVALPVEDTLFWIEGIKKDCIFANIKAPLLYFRASTKLIQRRGGLKMSILECSIRIKAINTIGLSKFYYFFAFLNLFARLLPVNIKKVLWKIRS